MPWIGRFSHAYVLIYAIHKMKFQNFFHGLTFAGSRGSCLNTRPIYMSYVQTSLKGPARETKVSILSYSNHIYTEDAAKTFDYQLSYTGFS